MPDRNADQSGGLISPGRPNETNTSGHPDPANPNRVTTEPGSGGFGPNRPDDSRGVGTQFPDRDQLRDSLIAKGYDPTRAAEIAAEMMANASQGSDVATPNVGSIGAGKASAGQMDEPTPIAKNTMASLLENGSGIEIGNTDVTTREVQDNELVDTQLNNLLSSDSRYIKNARIRGMEYANSRGQLGSSFSAGAAERAAIEAGLPIATADAQAYRDAATQNLNALNNFALANLQRATTLDVAILDSNTNISIANLDASIRVGMANLDAMTRVSIANLDAQTQTSIANLSSQTQLAMQTMQSQLQLTMQGREMTHQTGMEQLQQTGRVELALLDGDIRERLIKYEIDGQLDLSRLDHEERLEVENILHGYNTETNTTNHKYERQAQHALLASNAQLHYVDYITSFADSDMDSAAAARLKQESWNFLVAEFDMLNGLYPEFPPITPNQMSNTNTANNFYQGQQLYGGIGYGGTGGTDTTTGEKVNDN